MKITKKIQKKHREITIMQSILWYAKSELSEPSPNSSKCSRRLLKADNDNFVIDNLPVGLIFALL